MGFPFATHEDLEARWRPLSETEKDRADVLLGDASALLRDLAPTIDDRLDDGSLDPTTPRSIACAMVKRVMQGPVDMDGVTQTQQTAGPFMQGVSFANPSGDLYLTKSEKNRLGIGGRMVSVGLVGERWPLDPLD